MNIMFSVDEQYVMRLYIMFQNRMSEQSLVIELLAASLRVSVITSAASDQLMLPLSKGADGLYAEQVNSSGFRNHEIFTQVFRR